MIKKTLFILIGLTFLLAGTMRADEGMWLLSLINKNYETMKEMGLKLTPEDIYDINNSSLKDAVVIFGGGCTAEIVSEDGLLFTNHHCGYSYIQDHSTVEHDYLTDGFWAKTRDEELPNPGLTIKRFVRMEDVSEKINTQLNNNMTEDERNEKIDEIFEEIENDAIKENHYTARVRSFFGGNDFYLIVYEIFKDIRFVGTPPSAIGNFGEDTDNWMWPRHTGDFSIFRIYTAPDGTPAKYSPENIPYKPKYSLPVSIKGVKENDFTMVIGYPGGTQRYMTSFGIQELQDIIHPNRIKIRGLRQQLMSEDMDADDKVRIQYASKYARSSNYWKFSIGQSKGLKRLNIFEQKKQREADFTNWFNSDETRKQEYGEALELIENAHKNRKEHVNAVQYIAECLLRGSEFTLFAIRNGKAMESDTAKARKTADSFFKNYNAPTDKKISAALFTLFYNTIDKKFQPDIFHEIETTYNGNIELFISAIFESSCFVDEKKFNSMLVNKNADINSDLGYKTANSIYEKYKELRAKQKEYNARSDKGERLFIDGIMKMNEGKQFYPDANFTMRYTYGTVSGYEPADAVYYDYYTTLQGIAEKENPDNHEFIVPEKLMELYNSGDFGRYGENDVMPVCFITNNDITGGNSGSPVINGNGELIGLAFDGNWEAMSGDITFEPELQRCIVVDIRYVLFIIDKFAGVTSLIDELKIVEE